MNTLEKSLWVAGWLLAIATSAKGQTTAVLYDTLWIHDTGVMDAGVGNAIGGANGPLRETTDA